MNPITAAEAAAIARGTYYAAVGFAPRASISESAILYGSLGASAAAGLGITATTYHFQNSPRMVRGQFGFDDQTISRPSRDPSELIRSEMAGSKRRRSSKRAYRGRKKRRVAKRKARVNMRTAGFLGIEHKFVDYNYNEALVTSITGAEASPTTPGCLNALARGDSENERDGRKVRCTHIALDGLVNFEAQTQATPEGGHYVRILLVWDTQTNGVKMNSEDLFEDPGDANLEIHAHLDLSRQNRFKVLKDIVVWQHAPQAVWNGTNTLSAQVQAPFHLSCNLGKITHFLSSSTTAVIAGITDNSLHLIAYGSVGTNAKLQYTSRVRFYG